MPTALLLSPDEQAVSAITAVLEEMSVVCERPLDGVSAAQKLHAHRFDLVLVDCDNLPAAKLIFDVCRRGKGTNNPVPIAIVDGRAGLPTAFRLGAELILTKPVAKDQARSTIRTAVSRVKKEEPAAVAGQVNAIETNSLQSSTDPQKVPDQKVPEISARAATAAQSSLAASVPAVLRMIVLPVAGQAASADESKPSVLAKFSDSPAPMKLLTGRAMDAQLEPAILSSGAQSPESGQSKQEESNRGYSQPEEHHSLLAVLVLLVAVAGLYASWMYEPGFRALAQPQINRLLEVAGITHQSRARVPAPSPVRPAAQPRIVAANPAASAASGLPTTNPGTPDATASTSSTGAPAVISVSDHGQTSENQNKDNLIPADQSAPAAKNTIAKSTAGSLSDAGLPDEASTIVLSSKGAEKRLVHSVQPTYPAGASSHQVPATMVLKAFIDEHGNVAGATIVKGDTALATAAISAVKQWRYNPYIRDGKAQPFQTVVIVDFQQP